MRPVAVVDVSGLRLWSLKQASLYSSQQHKIITRSNRICRTTYCSSLEHHTQHNISLTAFCGDGMSCRGNVLLFFSGWGHSTCRIRLRCLLLLLLAAVAQLKSVNKDCRNTNRATRRSTPHCNCFERRKKRRANRNSRTDRDLGNRFGFYYSRKHVLQPTRGKMSIVTDSTAAKNWIGKPLIVSTVFPCPRWLEY